MLLYLLTENKQKRLLEYPFIAEAAKLHEKNELLGKSAAKFVENLALFEKQILRIISEREFDLLGIIGNNCSRPFDKVWEATFSFTGKPHFQTKREDSIFHEYSSRGWKIHLAFVKGKEKDIARFLFWHGLYFKVEMQIGTYFYGHLQSGATIYVGSFDDMMRIAHLIERKISHFLEIGTYYDTAIGRIPAGSGSDIKIGPNIMARFDVAKTNFGWLRGGKDYKYAEHGLATWIGLGGGIPILKRHEKIVSIYEKQWNVSNEEQRRGFISFFKRVYEESKKELIKDFGEEFVFGKNN